jgi:hypothetical protein
MVKERVDLYLYNLSGPSWPLPGWTSPLCHHIGTNLSETEMHAVREFSWHTWQITLQRWRRDNWIILTFWRNLLLLSAGYNVYFIHWYHNCSTVAFPHSGLAVKMYVLNMLHNSWIRIIISLWINICNTVVLRMACMLLLLLSSCLVILIYIAAWYHSGKFWKLGPENCHIVL